MSNGKVDDIYELSPLQQGMLWHSLHDGAADMYLSQHTYAIDGPLDPDALVGGWQAVVAAHPVLRTSFHWQDLDKPLQVVRRRSCPSATTTRPVSMKRNRLNASCALDRGPRRGIDLAAAPLQRLHVIRLGMQAVLSHLDLHHLLLDGWSIPISWTS